MTTTNSATPRIVAMPTRPRLHRIDVAGIGLLTWLGLGAAAGGLTLMAKPDGSNMGFETGILAGSPFADFLIPGFILFALFGLGSWIAAVLWIRHNPIAPFAAFAIGCAQMIWIVVELAIIKEVSFLHPLMFLTGAGIAACAVRAGWPTLEARRSRA